MSVQTLLILSLIAIVVSIAINYKTGINIGVPALIFAYILGCWCCKMKVKEIVACWPTSTLFQLMMITMFFSFGIFNGAMAKLANHLLYKMRKAVVLLPFILLVIAIIIGALGAPPPAVCTIMAVITFSIAQPAGLNPWICAIVVASGGAAGTFFPWAVQGSIIAGHTEKYLEGQGDKVAYSSAIGFIIYLVLLLLIFWIVTKGYKVKRIEMDKPEPFNKKQKMTLWIIVIIALLAIIPSLLKLLMPKNAFIKTASGYLDIQMLAIIGAFLCSILKLGDPKESIQKGIPWNTIFMVGGICTLLNMVSAAGVTEYLGGVLNDSVGPKVIIIIFTLLGGFMSTFSGAVNVVFPTLATIAVPYSQAAGISAIPLLVAIAVGASATAISPFSTGGAVAMANCPDQKIAEGLFVKQIILAIVGVVLAAILAFIGVFNI